MGDSSEFTCSIDGINPYTSQLDLIEWLGNKKTNPEYFL